MDAGECHFDSGTVGIRVANGAAVPSARRRICYGFSSWAAYGPLLHLASFTIAVILMAAAHRRLEAIPRRKRAVLSGVLFIAGVAGEELLYQGLRLLVLQKPVQWDTFFGEIFSPVILVVLLLLVTCINCSDSESQERSQK